MRIKLLEGLFEKISGVRRREKRDTPEGLSEEVKLSIHALSAIVQQMLRCAGLLNTESLTHWLEQDRSCPL